jgi:hypothetical protein
VPEAARIDRSLMKSEGYSLTKCRDSGLGATAFHHGLSRFGRKYLAPSVNGQGMDTGVE